MGERQEGGQGVRIPPSLPALEFIPKIHNGRRLVSIQGRMHF
jgi:hypothetical protein